MKRLILVTFMLVGCQSNKLSQIQPKQSAIPVTQQMKPAKPQKSPEEIRKSELRSFGEKVNKLNLAGKGSLRACTIKGYGNSINVFYSNEFGNRLVFRVYDEHVINSISMYLDKKQARRFIDYIQNSTLKAHENKELEELNLGRFSSGENWVMLTARRGRVSGFWGTEWVDRVLTPINYEEISKCSEKVIAYL